MYVTLIWRIYTYIARLNISLGVKSINIVNSYTLKMYPARLISLMGWCYYQPSVFIKDVKKIYVKIKESKRLQFCRNHELSDGIKN